jgi:hypothetical protein
MESVNNRGNMRRQHATGRQCTSRCIANWTSGLTPVNLDSTRGTSPRRDHHSHLADVLSCFRHVLLDYCVYQQKVQHYRASPVFKTAATDAREKLTSFLQKLKHAIAFRVLSQLEKAGPPPAPAPWPIRIKIHWHVWYGVDRPLSYLPVTLSS